MIHEEINYEAIALWEATYADDEDVWMPSIYSPLKEKSILFIGLNPSFSDRGFSTILAKSAYPNISPREFYDWKNRSKFNLVIAIEIEKIAKDIYSYFKKFKDIAGDLNLEWEHIDLFFYRETNQGQLKKVILNKDGMNEFGRKQLELSKKLLEAIKPKIIVVVNAFASNVFYNEYNLKRNFDEELGCHVTDLNGQSVPVFLASMLTGQRAMDNYSFERLKWHIKQVYEQVVLSK